MIQDDKDKAEILSDLALSLSLKGNIQAVEILQKAHATNRYIIPLDPGTLALRELSYALAHIGEYEQAQCVGMLTISESVKNEILGNLVSVLAKRGKYEYAYKIIPEISSDWFKSFSLRSISVALAQSENYEQAHALAVDIPSLFWKASALRTLATELFSNDLLRANGIFEETELTITKIDDKEKKVRSLQYLGIDLFKLGNARAANILGEARKIALEIEHDLFKTAALSDLAFAFTQIDDYEQAKSTALLIEDARKTGDSKRALAGVQAKCNRIDEAYQTALSIEDSITRGLTLVDLVAIIANKDNYEYAFSIASNIEDLGRKLEAFNILANVLAFSRQFTGASGAFATLGIRDPDRFVEMVSTWAKGFEEIEQGLFQKIIRETVRVISWAHPSWKSIYEIISPSND
ncbi:MAG: hypothetical protein L0154_22885 [Chloroflexi bacterium]|nr:hypothetical protein [Chloroflexota bacterium]